MATSVAEVQETLCAFIRGELLDDAFSDIQANTPLLSGGLLDSFRMAQLTTFLEERYGIYLPDVDLCIERIDTVQQIADLVVGKTDHAE